MCLKTKILKVAGELFFKVGIRSVSIDDICNELHISKKTFYTIFKQKDDLVLELLEAMRQKRIKDYRTVIEHDCNILDMLMQNVKKLRQHPIENHIAFGYDLEKFYPEIWDKHKKEIKEIEYKYTALMLHKGIEQNIFRNDLNVEATAILISNLMPNTLKDLIKLSMNTAQRVDYILDILVHMLCNNNGMNYYLQKKHIEL